MVVFPNAKINLGLNVVSRRKNGYHNLETVFYPIPLKDILEIVPSNELQTTFSSSGISIPQNGDLNLVERAYLQIQEKYKIPNARIHLHKVIPIGAGLGGGSSDAAFAINLINDIYELKMTLEERLAIAKSLGADCPFFINNTPVYAQGIGDEFSPIELDLTGYYLWLVNPGIHVSTASAYNGIIPKESEVDLKQILANEPINSWKDNVTNDFEKSVFKTHPEILEIKNKLYQKGALYACMSGSGSSVFGVFKSEPTGEFECSNWKLAL